VRYDYDPKRAGNSNGSAVGIRRNPGDFPSPYYLDHRNDDPEQWRAVGWSKGQLYAVIYEDREDEQGSNRHLVTLWKATAEEEKIYDENR